MIALIPARAGSKRCPGKNTRLLNGHPLIAYTIAAATQSGVFKDLVVCTDDMPLAMLPFGVRIFWRQPVSDTQPDIKWVRDALGSYDADAFALLRPTSPFRTYDTIRRAYEEFQRAGADSLRAVEPVKQTPFKMWERVTASRIVPLVCGMHHDGTPFHSSPTQTLPTVYIQNSSLEMSWTRNVTEHGTIHGRTVAPFFTTGHEGLSIDTEVDWDAAVALAAAHPELLPPLAVAGVSPPAPDDETADTCWAV